jgi:UDP-N-acetylmuramoyl-tripeptide--D-alanyl-D-alanine ligase
MERITTIFCGLSVLFYLCVRFKYELQMLQQNSYRNKRYLKWLKSDLFAFDRLFGWIVLLLLCLFSNDYISLFLSVILIIKAVVELKKKYKKPLVFTKRAIRLYATSLIIVVLSFYYGTWAAMSLAVLSFLALIVANIINSPLEKSINRYYYRDAKRIIKQNKSLIIIGITGSYGKTSTKHYLYRILSEKYNVLMTPGSYNTTLGVVRTIRESLKAYHEVFIVEMGAKQPGDIKEICELVHPRIGILTSVGEQHLESFKTIETVQKTKFELIDALPNDGLAVLNDDFEYIASRKVENVRNVVRYSFSNESADYYLDRIAYSKRGTNFIIRSKQGEEHSFSTKIVGNHNLSNILAGCITGAFLNVEPDAVKYAVSHIEQVEHRLSIKQLSNGITIIDDAFNSNPEGAKMALEVIKNFQGGKRILVTPGMIELGVKQQDYNYKLGEQAASACDYIILVGLYNREAIMAGLLAKAFDEKNIYLAATFQEAVNHLNSRLVSGDTVLYENDLPDTFK